MHRSLHIRHSVGNLRMKTASLNGVTYEPVAVAKKRSKTLLYLHINRREKI